MTERVAVRSPVSLEGPVPPGSGERYAVVVGINEYHNSGIRNLQFARRDAESVYRLLTDPQIGSFKRENVQLLVDEDAERRNIMSAIGKTLATRTGPRDLAVIYFAGHGAIDPDPSVDDGLQKYLVPHDADPDDLFSTAIPLDRVEEFFRRLSAAQIVAFFDCCYSGGAEGRSFNNPRVATRSVLNDQFLERLGTSSPGRFVVTSCRAKEVSMESFELDGGHGVFTYHLLEGLNGAADRDRDGLVTMDELFGFLAERVPDTARRLSGRMTPIKSGVTEGAIYLTRYESTQQGIARKRSAAAAVAFSSGDLDSAEQGWLDSVAAVPGYDDAVRGLASIAERRASLRRERMAAEQREREVREARLARIRRFVETGELTQPEHDRAARLLQADAGALGTDVDRHSLVELLAEGKVNAAQYRVLIAQIDAQAAPPPAAPSTDQSDFTKVADPRPAVEEVIQKVSVVPPAPPVGPVAPALAVRRPAFLQAAILVRRFDTGRLASEQVRRLVRVAAFTALATGVFQLAMRTLP